MNIEIIKNELNKKIGIYVRITVFGMRNKIDYFEGKIHKIYPNIFTIVCLDGVEKSFAYRDIITKDISVKYL